MGVSESKQKKGIKIPQNMNFSLSQAKLDQITILKQEPHYIIFEIPIMNKKYQRQNSSIAASVASTRPSNSTNKYSSRSSSSISNTQPHKRPPSKPKPGLTCTIKKQCSIEQQNRQKKQLILKKIIVNTENQHLLRQALQTIQQGKIQDNHKNGGNHVCKLVGFQREYEGFMCGKHSGVTVVMEYFGGWTLGEEVRARSQEIFSKTRRAGDHESIQQILSHSFKLQQILTITKFLLQICQFLPNIIPNQTPSLSLFDIFIPNSPTPLIHPLKYRHPLDSLYSQHRDNINKYNPFNFYSCNETSKKQESSQVLTCLLQNVATCAMSVALLEDCFQTCFGHLGQICESLCERKLEFLYQLYARENDEKIVREFCQILQLFLFPKKEETLTLTKAKSLFSKLYLNFQKQVIKNKIQMSSMQLFDEDTSKSPILIQKLRNTKNVDTSLSMQLKQKDKKKTNKDCSPINKAKFVKSCHSVCKNQQNLQNVISSRDLSLNRKKDWNIDKSTQRKIQINQSLMPRTKQWVIENQIDFKVSCVERKQSMKHLAIDMILEKYQQIDKRWSEDEELFKGMPQFSRFSSQVLNLHFDVADLQPIKAEGKHQYVFLR